MATGHTVGESQLQRIIRDLNEAVGELAKEYRENGEPITDDSSNLHKFSYKLEYLLQFDQKEKTTFLGTKKDYWDYFVDCLAKIKGANDGIRFVKSISELKTSLGKGRAFIRYSLVHQRLADTLQQCLMNQRVTSDWYYSRSPLLKTQLNADIINHLYELNEVQFDVASRGYDLDAAWPTFARRTIGSVNSPGHMWKPPSRSSSINSLASSYSQQAAEFPCSPDFGHGLLNDLNDSLPACSEDVGNVEDLRLELDQSELKQRELLDKVLQLGEEAAEARGVVLELQRQLEVSLAAQEEQQGLYREVEALRGREEMLTRELDTLKAQDEIREVEQNTIQEKLVAAEKKNLELLVKLDGVLNEKDLQTASFFDSAQKMHELLDQLKVAEKGKIEAEAKLDEMVRHAQRLEEELKLKETARTSSETELKTLFQASSAEKAEFEVQIQEQSSALQTLQESLDVKENEARDLIKQTEELQRSLEEKEKEMQEVKQKSVEFEDEMQRKLANTKKTLEVELEVVKGHLEQRDLDLSTSSQTIQQLNDKNKSLNLEQETLTAALSLLERQVKEQDLKLEDSKAQCSGFMHSNEKLLKEMKKNDELKNAMEDNRAVLENELAALRASEKQLRGQLDDAMVTVDEKEKRLREENCRLDEDLHKANMAAEVSAAATKRLEEENHSLKEEQENVKEALNRMQANLKNLQTQILDFECKLETAQKNELNLQEKLQTVEDQLKVKEQDFLEVQSTVKNLEARKRELQEAKEAAEAACARQSELIQVVTNEKTAIVKSELEKSAVQAKENQEVIARLSVVQDQLEMSMKEASRLQADILDVRVAAQRSEEEKLKFQAQLQVTEVQMDEFRTLTEQLKVQIEEQNQRHVAELLDFKKKEDALCQQRDREMAARAEMSASLTAIQDEAMSLKTENNRLALENSETREVVHRANTEMAELGMTICKLNAEKEDASKHWTNHAARNEELEKEVELQKDLIKEVELQNSKLKVELAKTEGHKHTIKELQEELEETKSRIQKLQDSSKEDLTAIKFQLSSESMTHQVQMKSVTDELDLVKTDLKGEQESVLRLTSRVCELQVNEKYLQLNAEKDAHITKAEERKRKNEAEIQHLSDALTSAQDAGLALQSFCEELKQKLNTTETGKTDQFVQFAAEIDDLKRTKSYLEERLIELIRDKDTLWKKSDALEFEQKLRAEERWWLVDKDITHCLGCQSQFSWWMRRHHCRLCGRIFCYSCCGNYVLLNSSAKKERCCKDCYAQHSAVVERLAEADLSSSDMSESFLSDASLQQSPEPAPDKPTPRVPVSDCSRSDDGTYDIITEEEVNGVYDSDATSQTTGGSFEGDRPTPGSLDIGIGDGPHDESEESCSFVQDSETNLLKSGEITATVPLSVRDFAEFGDSSRELFIKSSSYSVINVAMNDCGSTISWMFSSEPKSISFSVVYQESADSPAEESKVLIPLTRCNSHKETIRGQLKVRNPGIYKLIFDNSFSRFVSKKVFYHLTMEKPIIYDGSDLP
ncbi:LOW QUALITY PROTEIN: FYVE and coiled-coil domain-containing protein 1 [Neosynchiropus ocellatus]